MSDRQPPRGPRVIPEGEPAPVTPRAMPQAEPLAPPPGGPRVILDEQDTPAPRLDFQWEQAVVPVAVPRPSVRWSGIGRAIGGLAVLGGGLAALDAANFRLGPVRPRCGAGLGDARCGRRRRGAARLRPVAGDAWAGLDPCRGPRPRRLRPRRPGGGEGRGAALGGSVQDAAPLQPAIRGAASIEELGALLQPALAALEARAGALGRNAAVQSFAVTAISPSPGLDALVFAWRGVRLVRQVAALHGLRPGLRAPWRCCGGPYRTRRWWRRPTSRWMPRRGRCCPTGCWSKSLGEAAAGAVAARRMLRLARVAAEACRILPPR